MDPGGFARDIGGGVGALIGGSIQAIGDGIAAIVRAGEQVLPGPLFPIAVIATVGVVAYWVIRK
jgi:hypothetical protein